jgi:hypothetical protein
MGTLKSDSFLVPGFTGGGAGGGGTIPADVMKYKGDWDANTNTPTLSNATGVLAHVYRVSVGGTQDLGSGARTFTEGDWILFDGTVWQQANHEGEITAIVPNELQADYLIQSSWRQTDALQNNTWIGIEWLPEYNRFVAISTNGTDRVALSDDGINWTPVTVELGSWNRLAYSPSFKIVCAVSRGGSPNHVIISTDGGETWTGKTAPLNAWNGVAWSPKLNMFCAVSEDGFPTQVMTSTDLGNTWVAQTVPSNQEWTAIEWSPDLEIFVACAYSSSGGGNQIMTSPDGVNWTLQSTAAAPNGEWYDIAWSPYLGIFTVTGGSFGDFQVMTSPDGINWTPTPNINIPTGSWNSITWADEIGLFCSASGTGSPDAVNWQALDPIAGLPGNTTLDVVWASGLGIFATVGATTLSITSSSAYSYANLHSGNFGDTDILTALDGKQPLDDGLTSISALTTAADQMIYTTALDTYSTTALTATARTLLDDATISDMQTTLGAGAANGLATLDVGGKVPVSQLPSSFMEYKGTWDANTNSPTLADGAGDTGDVYIVSVAGTQDLGSGPITFAIDDWVIYNGSIWQKSVNSNSVASVFGRTGAVVSASGDYTASQITNVAAGDIIATDVQAAINELDIEKQPIDAGLTSISGLTTAADTMIYTTGLDTYATTALTGAARTLLDDATIADMRTTLGAGAANGLATLDGSSQLTSSQLPTSAMEYKGDWNADTNSPSLADGSGNTGDVYRVSVSGTIDLGSGAISFVIDDWVTYDGSVWTKQNHNASGGGAVDSVFGRTGTVVAVDGDYSKDLITGLKDTDAPTFAEISITDKINYPFDKNGQNSIINNPWYEKFIPAAGNKYVIWIEELGYWFVINNATTTVARYSSDSINWNNTTFTGTARQWSSAAWSPSLNLLVAGNLDGISGPIQTTSDLSSWTIVTMDASQSSLVVRDIVWAEELGIFVAIGNNVFSPSQCVATSSDGITWTPRSLGTVSQTWSKVTWSGTSNLFVAVARTGTQRLATSPDGITWTISASADDTASWHDVIWAEELGLFISVGDTGKIQISPNGFSWSLPTLPAPLAGNTFRAVAWGKQAGVLYAHANTTLTGNPYAYSFDGITWVEQEGTVGGQSLAWSPSLQVFLGVNDNSYVHSSVSVRQSDDPYNQQKLITRAVQNTNQNITQRNNFYSADGLSFDAVTSLRGNEIPFNTVDDVVGTIFTLQPGRKYRVTYEARMLTSADKQMHSFGCLQNTGSAKGGSTGTDGRRYGYAQGYASVSGYLSHAASFVVEASSTYPYLRICINHDVGTAGSTSKQTGSNVTENYLELTIEEI